MVMLEDALESGLPVAWSWQDAWAGLPARERAELMARQGHRYPLLEGLDVAVEAEAGGEAAGGEAAPAPTVRTACAMQAMAAPVAIGVSPLATDSACAFVPSRAIPTSPHGPKLTVRTRGGEPSSAGGGGKPKAAAWSKMALAAQ